ncbi:conserved Plasmodium protein, unknown function [Plasmodium ovale wallikeri]|uniref:Uncharacterized protein n=1 Tax=Plasmodium ovale wallikeri TaxID=864142 RepID=A0A1A8YYX7_PLAOA|nr:conserved Plasmodium protein, unknown function [Plasmodium ovale wallikeri]SBT36742.1 conserved Plasmodium protein, unknown function [Plasmodium ovale wallikeri]
MREGGVCKEEDSNTIERYRNNPFINTKEDYYNEKIQKIICSILVSKNVKKVNCLVFDLLFDFFMKIIKTLGMKCRKFSSLRGSVVVNYIDIKYCLKLGFYNLYKEIYIVRSYSNLFGHFIFDLGQEDKIKKKNNNYINVVQNSYLYYKELCMKKKEKYDSLNEFNSINYLSLGNCTSNENVNVLFLHENIDIEKYKQIMKLKKRYVHDHMPIIPLFLNRKEKKTGYYNDKNEYYENSSSSSNSSSESSSISSNQSSDHSNDYLNIFSHTNSQNKDENIRDIQKKENMGKEKIEILNLIPKLKDIYVQNAKWKDGVEKEDQHLFNSLNIFDPHDYQTGGSCKQ